MTHSDTSSELIQLSAFLTYRVSRLHSKLNAQASKILGELVGLSLNQWRMMAFIGSAKTLTATELVAYTAMDKGLISRNVKTLINKGLVTSSVRKNDNRWQVLSLTPEGQAIYDVALPVMRRRQNHLQKGLSREEIGTFRKVMAALEEAAEETNI